MPSCADVLVGPDERPRRATALRARAGCRARRTRPSALPSRLGSRRGRACRDAPSRPGASGLVDREVGMARELARECERRFVAVGEAQVVQGVCDDDLGLRANEIVAPPGAVDVIAVEDRPVAEGERIGRAEEARQAARRSRSATAKRSSRSVERSPCLSKDDTVLLTRERRVQQLGRQQRARVRDDHEGDLELGALALVDRDGVGRAPSHSPRPPSLSPLSSLSQKSYWRPGCVENSTVCPCRLPVAGLA